MKLSHKVKDFLFCMLLLASFSASAVAADEERITSAQAKFKDVVTQSPQKMIPATIYFTNNMELEQVKSAVKGQQFAVNGFRHGTRSHSGGYTLKPSETLDEAMENYTQDHILFLEQRKKQEGDILRTETDANIRKAVISHLEEADKMSADFEEKGLRIIGIDLSGRAVDIQNFKEKNSFARVIELKEGGRSQSAIILNP